MNENAAHILSAINEGDVKFIKLQFIDLFGCLKNISITSGQIGRALQGKFMIDGYHIAGMKQLGYEHLYLRPDLSTFAILPWRPQTGKVARLFCDLTDADGREFSENPRRILRNVLAGAEKKGWSFDVKPDCEFFLFTRDENGHITTHTGEMAGYLDIAPLDKGENARRELILSLEEMGLEIESSRHELSHGQHSVIFKQQNGVRLADQIVTFRTTIRTVAERHGLHATFMPKPRTDLPGSAMKLTFTVTKDGKNLFEEDDQAALHFIAGMLAHERAIAAFSNPLVNSYKRIGISEFAPSASYWSRHDRYASVRYTENEDRSPVIEWMLPDGAANPYLILAAMIAAGMEGMDTEAQPPAEETGKKPLPATLLESLDALRKDELLNRICGDSFINTYIQEKEKEWKRYSMQVTNWELNEYLRMI